MTFDENSRPFSYKAGGGKLMVFWNSRLAMTLKGKQAVKTINRLDGASADQAQLIMAKLTGNFKHGNERSV